MKTASPKNTDSGPFTPLLAAGAVLTSGLGSHSIMNYEMTSSKKVCLEFVTASWQKYGYAKILGTLKRKDLFNIPARNLCAYGLFLTGCY